MESKMAYKGIDNFSHGQADKVGVLLVNLGTPAAPTTKALRTYLRQFLSDRRVVEIPRLLWMLILHGIILRVRPKKIGRGLSRSMDRARFSADELCPSAAAGLAAAIRCSSSG
jgi:hypothetical protein